MSSVLTIEGESKIPLSVSKTGAKPLALVDLDGTTYPGLIMEFILNEQLIQGFLPVTAALPIWIEIHDYKSGQKGQAFNVKELNAWWALACRGIPYINLLDHARECIKQGSERFFPYTKPAFDLLNSRGYEIWLMTGEPQFVAQAVMEEFGATGFCASRWLVDDSFCITGQIRNIMTSHRKASWARRLLSNPELNYDRTRTIALIDSANDIGLADTASYSIVCEGTNPDLMNHLAKNSRAYTVSSPENMLECVELVTR